MYWVVIDQVHVLLQRMVHESETIRLSWVRIFDIVTLVLKPSDLVGTDAVHASVLGDAASTAGTEEPDTSIDLLLVVPVLDWHIVGELMMHLAVEHVVVVGQRGRISLLSLCFEHLI